MSIKPDTCERNSPGSPGRCAEVFTACYRDLVDIKFSPEFSEVCSGTKAEFDSRKNIEKPNRSEKIEVRTELFIFNFRR